MKLICRGASWETTITNTNKQTNIAVSSRQFHWLCRGKTVASTRGKNHQSLNECVAKSHDTHTHTHTHAHTAESIREQIKTFQDLYANCQKMLKFVAEFEFTYRFLYFLAFNSNTAIVMPPTTVYTSCGGLNIFLYSSLFFFTFFFTFKFLVVAHLAADFGHPPFYFNFLPFFNLYMRTYIFTYVYVCFF